MTAPIVIMGAHGGIGEALTQMLDKQGESLFLTARDADTLSSSHPTASVDVTNAESITHAIEKADEGDGIKGLAYCVGTLALKPLKATKDEDFLAAYQVNLLGAVHALKAAEKALKKANGSVVLFSSIAVQQGFGNHAVISSAKGAVEGLMRALAAEWAPHIRVNAIAPSLTDTPLASSLTLNDKMKEAIAGMHPIPRLGTPDDIAAVAAYLLSDASGWVTGQVMHVDGGRSSVRTKG